MAETKSTMGSTNTSTPGTPTAPAPGGAKAPPKGPSKGIGIGKLVIAPLVPVLGIGALVLACAGFCIGVPCVPTGLKYGMWPRQCPTGDVRLGARLEAYGLVRGAEGTLSVLPYGRFLQGEGAGAWVSEATMDRGVELQVAILDAEDQEVPGLKLGKWKKVDGWRQVKVTLPEIPDGDYKIRVTVTTSEETIQVYGDLPLYAPAIAHVMTDRPLYKPGQEVLFRSILLKETDLTPLDGRPGKWHVTAPDGTEMLLERDRAGAYGVADSSFPLDSRADVGTWSVRWESGKAQDTVQFDVFPFKLPRFTVEMTPSARWYNIDDRVVIDGIAAYTSGAPVANAPVEIDLSMAEGRWPLPIEWEETFETRTGPDGRFSLELGKVPADLIERNAMRVVATVTEEAGETASGGASVVLSEDDLKVEAVTELGDGLVGGFNNRAYLRVATPDGVPLPNAQVVVKNPWDALAKPREAETDVDGVLALQVDPGDPVTVVIPAVPYRARPLKPDLPSVWSASQILTGASLDMAERRALDAVVPDIARCGAYTIGGKEVTLGARVTSTGQVRDVLTGGMTVERCVADAMRRVSMPGGRERTYAISWYVPDNLVASFPTTVKAAYGESRPADTAFQEAALRARGCVAFGKGVSGAHLAEGHWRVAKDSTAIESTLEFAVAGTGFDLAEIACIRSAYGGARLDVKASADAMGTFSAAISVPSASSGYAPGPTTQTGYELEVTATADGAAIGETRLVLPVGTIPDLRLRATPSLANPGDEILIEMFRGPSFYGDLPKKLYLQQGSAQIAESPVDEATNSAKFTIPSDRDGFFHVDVTGARAVIFVQPPDPLSVALATDKDAYRPGETATLSVTTLAGESPTPAGVGLVGVDQTLGQLKPLLGPDDYGRVTVRATSDRPAFGAFDPRALTLGQIHGENAAKAAVLRISNLPASVGGDEFVSVYQTSTHNDDEVLIGSFYRALEALIVSVRAWETSAPAGEMMSPEKMVALWDAVLKDLEKKGTPAVDAFGRPLTLDILPYDLLRQVDPRQVVSDGTRLPEDVVSWEGYVADEVGK